MVIFRRAVNFLMSCSAIRLTHGGKMGEIVILSYSNEQKTQKGFCRFFVFLHPAQKKKKILRNV